MAVSLTEKETRRQTRLRSFLQTDYQFSVPGSASALLAELDNFHRPMIVGDLKNFGVFVQNWFKGDAKVPEGKLTEEVKLLEK